MEQKQSKFYQTKAFRRWMAVLLAVVLLANNLVENRISLFAGEEQAPAEVTAPVENTEQAESEPAPAPAEKVEKAPEPAPAKQEATEAEAPAAPVEREQDAVEVIAGADDEGAEATDEATEAPAEAAEAPAEATEAPVEATEEPVETVAPEGHPVALALAQYGQVYVRIGGAEIYPSNSMNEKKVLGELGGGLAIAIGYQAADEAAEMPESIRIAYATEKGDVETAFRHAGDAEPVLYEDAILELTGDLPEGETLPDFYQSAEWPLPRMSFIPHEVEATPAPTEEPVEELPVIVAFVGYETPGEPMETIEVELNDEEPELALAEVELPQSLSVLLSDDSVVDLPVSWATEPVAAEALSFVKAAAEDENLNVAEAVAEAEETIAAAAENTMIAAGEALDVVPTWDIASFALGDDVNVPFITAFGFGTFGLGDGGTLIITCNDIPETQTTYDLMSDTTKSFEVRYLPPPGGTNNTILIIRALEYGAMFDTPPPAGANAVATYINSADPSYVYVQLINGLEKEVILDCTMYPRALTNAQASAWIDNGTLPATSLSVKAVRGTMGSGSIAPTVLEELCSATYGSLTPAVYTTPNFHTFVNYHMTVPSTGAVTNAAFSVTNWGSSTGYYTYYYGGSAPANTPYYAFRNATPHVNSMPLIEYTGIKVYTPSNKLKLIGVGSSSSYYSFSTSVFSNNSYNGLGTWTIASSGSDANGEYYIVRPPVGNRYFNNGYGANIRITSNQTLYPSIRLNWQLKDVDDELPYAASAYTTMQGGAGTQWLYKVAGVSGEQVLNAAAPIVRTFAREEYDDFAVIPPHERQINRAGTITPGTTYNVSYSQTYDLENTFSGLRNTYHIDRVAALYKEWVPKDVGPVTETYKFPYELRPNSIQFSVGSINDSYGNVIKRETDIESITYKRSDGTTTVLSKTAGDAAIINLNTFLQGTTATNTAGLISFTGLSDSVYVTDVTVKWNKVGTKYYTYNGSTQSKLTYNAAADTSDTYDYWYSSYRHFEVATKFGFTTTSTDKNDVRLVDNTKVQVEYAATAAGTANNSFNKTNYLWWNLKWPEVAVATCPTLYQSGVNYLTYAYGSGSYSSAWADGESEYTVGNLWLNTAISGLNEPQLTLKNPIINVTSNTKAYTAYALENLTDAQAIGFLHGEWQTSATLKDWDINFTTSKRSPQTVKVSDFPLSGSYHNIDLGLNYGAGEYLTSLSFSYDGDFTTTRSSSHYLMLGIKLHAWNKNFINGSEWKFPNGPDSGGATAPYGRFYVRISGTAHWENCLANCNRHHEANPQLPTSSSYEPSALFYLYREVGLSVSMPSASSVVETVYQGGSTNPSNGSWAGDFSYTVNANTSAMKWSSYAFRYYADGPSSVGNNYYVPWNISEEIFIELTDPELKINAQKSSLWGVSFDSENLTYSTVEVTDTSSGTPVIRRFLKLKLAEGYRRNSYFQADGRVSSANGNTLGGTLRLVFDVMPGSKQGHHKPLGDVYLDFSQLLTDYKVPTAATSKDKHTQWILGGAMIDEVGLQLSRTTSLPAATPKLYKHSTLSGYTINVVKFTTLAATLIPGKSGVYDFINRTVEYNSSTLNKVEAFLNFSGSDQFVVRDFTSYVTVPKKGRTIEYTDDGSTILNKTSNVDFFLRGAPEIISLPTGVTKDDVIFAYTTSATPGASASYTFVPTTKADWDAVTGIKIVVPTMPVNGAASLTIPYTSAAKDSVGTLYAYSGGTYSYVSDFDGLYSGRLRLNTYVYGDFAVTQPYGVVYYDYANENGIYNGGTEGYATGAANYPAVTVRLLDTDGSVIDSTTTNASGQYRLNTYKLDAGQTIEIVMPNNTPAGATYKLTKQNTNNYATATPWTGIGTDSDFPRNTVGAVQANKLVLSAIPENGFSNISAGLVRLPELVANDVTLLKGETKSFSDTVKTYMTSSKTSYPGYTYTLSPAADTAIATVNNGTGNPVAITTTTSSLTNPNVTISKSITAAKLGTTTATLTATNTLGDVVTATYNINVTVPTQTITVTKTWSDGSNVGKVRPDSIFLQLYRKVDGGALEAYGAAKEVTGSSTGNTWTTTFTDVPTCDEDSNDYTYSVGEVDPPKNYTVTYGGSGKSLTVTNTIRYIPVTGKKVWNIIGSNYTKLNSIIVDLYRSDNAAAYLASQTVSTTGAGPEWAFTFNNMLEYDKNGEKFVYTVKERTVPPSNIVAYDGTTITNTYPADKDVNIKIEWVTTGAPSDQRPTSTTVTLRRNGVNYPSAAPLVTINATDGVGGWEKTVKVPPLDYDTATFSIIATPVTDYAITYRTEGDGTLVAIYTFVMPRDSITGTKSWVLPAGVTKPNVTIKLMQNGDHLYDSKTLVGTDTGYTFSNLPRYDENGDAYTYTVEEAPVPGFTPTLTNKYNFTNTYSAEPKELDAIFTKKVEGNGAPDETFTFTMTGSAGAPMPAGSTGLTKEVKVKKGSQTFGLITFDKPGSYTYTIKETAGPTAAFAYDGSTFTMKVDVVDKNGVLSYTVTRLKGAASVQEILFTNVYTIPTSTLTGTLTWDDNANVLGGRPANAKVQLYRIVEGGTEEKVTGALATPTGSSTGSSWNYSFANMPRHNNDYKDYTYYVKQEGVDANYTATANGMNLTDKLNIYSLTGKKVWDIQGTGFKYPDSLEIEIFREGVSLKKQTISDGETAEWAFTIGNLLQYKPDGSAYTYTLKELTQMTGVTTQEAGTTITNTYGEDQKINVRVDWFSDGAPPDQRPTDVSVDLIRDGTTAYKNANITLTNNWKHIFTVPQNIYPISTFTVRGEDVPGYTKVETKEADGTLVVTYTFIRLKTKVEGTKTWPNFPATGVTKPQVKVNLFQNEGTNPIRTATINPTDPGYSFTGLEQYDDDGIAYEYTVTEDTVHGFTTTYDGYNIINTYSATPSIVTVLGTKKVEGDGAPNETFTFVLTGAEGSPMPSGSTGQTKEATTTGEGSFSFGTINYTVPGTFTYTIKETAGNTEGFLLGSGYDASVYDLSVKVEFVDADGSLKVTETLQKGGATVSGGIVFTNKYTIPSHSSVNGTLTWDDTNNELGGRPANVKVQLYRTPEGGVAEAVSGELKPVTGGANAPTWTYSFTNLPKHDKDGKTYTYTVQQVDVDPNYTATPSGMDLTDKLNTTSISGKKIWDIRGSNFDKPEMGIEIELLRDGSLYRTHLLPHSSSDEWAYTIDNLLKFTPSGASYTYTVREKTAMTAVKSEVVGYDITNTYGEDAKIEVTVKVVNTGAPSDDRPKNLTVDLIRDGGATPYDTCSVTPEEGGVLHTFTVPQNEFQGSDFIAKGADHPGYTKAEEEVSDGVWVITYTYIRPKFDIGGTKTWENVPASMTAPGAEFILTRNGDEYRRENISGTDEGYSFPDLDVYDEDGELYTYEVTESRVPGYDSTRSGNNFTNTYNPTKAEIGVLAKKTVSDENAAPDVDFTFTLTGAAGAPMPAGSVDQVKTVDAKRSVNFETITYSVPGEFTYTVRETAGSVEGFTYDTSAYTVTVKVEDIEGELKVTSFLVDGDDTKEIIFNNIYTIPNHPSLDGTLTWDDNGNELGGRPANAKVQLYRTPDGGVEEVVSGELKTVTGGSTDATWDYSFTNLPKHDANGNQYTYTVKQVDVDANYTATPSGMNLTDKLNTTSISGKKIWDIRGSDFVKPEEGIVIELLRNGDVYREHTIDSATGDEWAYTIDNLLKFDPSGEDYTYTVREKTQMTAVEYNVVGYDITNSYGEDAVIKIHVDWTHTGAPQTLRPDEVVIKLFRDGIADPFKTITVYKADNWDAEITVPQADYQGYVFSIVQDSLLPHYSTEYDKNGNTLLIAKNTYVMPKVKVEGKKEWFGTPSGVAKPEVYIYLVRDNKATEDYTVIPNTKTTYEFTNLDKYDADGEPYTYSVAEATVSGYDSERIAAPSDDPDVTIFNFRNTYNPTKASFDVRATKTVNDNVGAPDDDFTFKLTADDPDFPMPADSSVAGEKKLLAKEGLVDFGTITFDVPGTYTYTVQEEAGSRDAFDYDDTVYTLTIEVKDTDGVLERTYAYSVADVSKEIMLFHNEYTVPTSKVSGSVTWDDDSDKLEGRPSSVTVQLYRVVAGGTREAVSGATKVVSGDSSSNVWSFDFENMPEHDNDGKDYTYSVEQTSENKNYTATATGMDITDKLNSISLTGKKVWDIKGSNFNKPAEIMVQLYRNGGSTPYLTQKVEGEAAESEWNFTISPLLKYDPDGEEYAYTLDEVNTMTAVTHEVVGTTITNTYGEDAQIAVKVVWDHTGAPSDDKPTEFTLNLHRDGAATAYLARTINGSSNGQWYFAVTQADFKGSTFSVTQEVPAGYIGKYATVYSKEGDVLVVTNTYIRPKTTVEGTKTWIKPGNVTEPGVVIELLCNGEYHDVNTLIPTGETAYKFENLEVYDESGERYTYTVRERNVPGYDSVIKDTYHFENTYNPQGAATSVLGDKQVTDGVGAPASEKFEFTLTGAPGAPMPDVSGGQIMTVKAPEGPIDFGTINFTLPNTYVYTIAEVAGTKEGFTYDQATFQLTVTVEDDGDGNLVVTDKVMTRTLAGTTSNVDDCIARFDNVYAVPTEDYEITIEWDDDSDALSGRPDDVVIQLYRKTENGEPEVVPGSEKIVSGTGDTWSFTYEDMPIHDNNGDPYIYSVQETGLDKNYTGTVEDFTITNKLNTIKKDGKKVWDIKGSDFPMPDDLKIQLYRSGSPYGNVQTIDGDKHASEWPFSFSGLLEFDKAGDAYEYTAQEVAVPAGCEVSYDGMTITNTYGEDEELKVKVIWDYTGAPADDKPTTTTVVLLRDGIPFGDPHALYGPDWETSFYVPLLEHDGHIFKVVQDPKLEMYDTDYDEQDGWLVVINTYKMPPIDVKGEKTWINKPDEIGFPTVKINLYRDDNPSTPLRTTDVVNGPEKSEYEFKDLPTYNDEGVRYIYTVSESPVPGYDSDQDGYNFTNTYNPQGAQTALIGKKTRTGTAAPDEEFTFVLTPKNAANPMPSGTAVDGTKTIRAYAGPVAVDFGTITYTRPGTYEYTITETAGTTTGYDYDDSSITVTVVVEDNGIGALTQTTSYDGASTFEFVNEYTIPTENKLVTVNWVDNSDSLGLRPADATVQLYRSIPGGAAVKVQGASYIIQAVAGDSWTHTFLDMPVHDDNGEPYTYSVQEEDVDPNYSNEASGLVITNTLRTAGVSIAKTASPRPETADSVPAVKAGDIITYTLKVTNTGARSVFDVRVMDIVPAGLKLTSVVPSAGITTPNADGTTTLMWRIAEIARDGVATITIQAEVDALAPGVTARTFSNMGYARMPAEENEPFVVTDPTDPDKPFTPTDDPVVHQQLILTKNASPSASTAQDNGAVVEGQVITYSMRLDNVFKAAGITVKDVLPLGVSFVPGSIVGGTGGYFDVASRSVIWANQTFPAGGVTLSFKVTVDKFVPADGTSKQLENTAVVTYEHTGEASVSDDSNKVTHIATRRVITATKNAQLVTGGIPSGVNENGSLSAPIEAKLGQEIEYAITVDSAGYLGGKAIIEDVLHKDAVYNGAMQVIPSTAMSRVTLLQIPDATNGNKAIWEISSLNLDETITIKFRAKAPLTADDAATTNVFETVKLIPNTAKVIDEALKNLTNGATAAKVYTEAECAKNTNTTYHVVYEAALIAHKSSNPASPLANGDIVVVKADDIIEYTIRVENPGMDDAINVRVMDILPEGVQYVSGSSSESVMEFNVGGKTTLMWQIAKLDHADRDSKALTPGGVKEIRFQVKVLAENPPQARLIENKAYYRLPESSTEAFPLVSGQPDPIDGYIVTRERVAHQTYTVTSTADPVGGQNSATATEVKPGDIVTYTTTVDAAAVIHGVTVIDTVPAGMVPVSGSISIIKPDGQVVKLPDLCYNGVAGTITWPVTDVTNGKTRFVFEAIVGPLTGTTMNREFVNGVSVEVSDGKGGTITTPTLTQYHKTSVGYNTVTKTAQLVVGGSPIAADNGTEANPVYAERGQEIQYTLVATRDAGVDNQSGEVIITDALPDGMTFVEGSLQTATSAGVGIVSTTAKMVPDGKGAMKPGVEMVITGMGSGDTATLTFRAKMPNSADSPNTSAIETTYNAINTALVTDAEMRSMTYAKAVAGHPAGEQMYPAADYIRESGKTYHYMLGAALVSVKSADRPDGSRVNPGDILTYTIAITNAGQIPAKDVLVRDTISEFVTYVEGSATSDAPGTIIGRTGDVITWIIPEISVNETVTLTLQWQVNPMAEIGVRVIRNVAMVRETTPGGDPQEEIKEEGENPIPSNPVDVFQMVGGTIAVRKTNAAGDVLEGATITLRQISSASPLTVFDTIEAVTDEEGEVEFGDIPIGQYVVYESEAPEGYALNTIRRSANITPDHADHLIIIVDQFLLDNAVPNVGAGTRCVGDSPN